MPEFSTTAGDQIEVKYRDGTYRSENLQIYFEELKPHGAKGDIQTIKGEDFDFEDLLYRQGSFDIDVAGSEEEVVYKLIGCRLKNAYGGWEADLLRTEIV